jgi:hypothetical protein
LLRDDDLLGRGSKAHLKLPDTSDVGCPIGLNSLGGMVNGGGFNLSHHFVVSKAILLNLGITRVHTLMLRTLFGGRIIRSKALV